MLTNSQNASDFDNLRVRKISTSKRLQVRIIYHLQKAVETQEGMYGRHLRQIKQRTLT